LKSLKTTVLFVAALLVTSAAFAADGVLIVEKTTSGDKSQTHQVQIEKDRMRAEVTGAAGELQVFMFDAGKQTMSIVHPDRKTYSEITKADVDRLGGQMSDATAMLEQQMKGMSPEQRAQMEAMMRGRGRGMPGVGAAAAKTEYKKTGTDKVGKWTCEKYEGFKNGEKTVELCTVPAQTLGFTDGDFEVSRQLQAFFSKMTPGGADSMFRVGTTEEQGFSGVPVRRVTFGPRPSSTEIMEVTRQRFPDSTFVVPAGFQKEASPFEGRGRGRGPGR
jgi:hypothetical protein